MSISKFTKCLGENIKTVCFWGLAVFIFSTQAGQAAEMLDIRNLKSREMASAYFDRAMGYQNSRFAAVSLVEALDRVPFEGGADALILRCRDDYEGIISFDDIRRYDIRLATDIRIDPQFKRPSWLQAWLLLIPDDSSAPSMERFMTANIEKIYLASSVDYYAPLDKVVMNHPEAVSGSRVYKQNCLFCHRLKGIGGNKGGSLLAKFDFGQGGRDAMESAFLNFHHKMNEDKQNVEQFVSHSALKEIGLFLSLVFSEDH